MEQKWNENGSSTAVHNFFQEVGNTKSLVGHRAVRYQGEYILGTPFSGLDPDRELDGEKRNRTYASPGPLQS